MSMSSTPYLVAAYAAAALLLAALVVQSLLRLRRVEKQLEEDR